MKTSLRGNKSKGMILKATERFRCHCLTSGQFRCQGFASGRFRCVLNLVGLCGQFGCRYNRMQIIALIKFEGYNEKSIYERLCV